MNSSHVSLPLDQPFLVAPNHLCTRTMTDVDVHYWQTYNLQLMVRFMRNTFLSTAAVMIGLVLLGCEGKNPASDGATGSVGNDVSIAAGKDATAATAATGGSGGGAIVSKCIS
jgi:hypothetical protein